MSEFRIDQITNQAGTSGPQIAGITTFNSTSGLIMPSGNTNRRYISEVVPKNIVSEGLVLYFDANILQSYPEYGSTWTDLSGRRNDGTFVNGPTYGKDNNGYILFDGVDDYIQFSTISVQTVCFWGRMDPTIPNLAALVATSASGDGSLRTVPAGTFRTNTDSNDFQNGYVSSFMINGYTNLPSGGDNGLIIPNNRTLFQDFYVGAIGNPRNISTISHNFLGRVYKGRVYAVALYDRQLASFELLQNFNALRSRYGL